MFWVETKGKTLEEIDALFGEKHEATENVELPRVALDETEEKSATTEQ